MNTKILIPLLFSMILILPQYAFSIEPPSNNFNNTSSTINNSTTNSSAITSPSNHTSSQRIPSNTIIGNSTKSTTILITSSLNPSTVSQPVTFTATVSPKTATGTIQFTINGINTGYPVTLSGGTATVTIASFTVGTHYVNATYSGDINNAASTATLTQTVNQIIPSVTVSSSHNPSTFGQSISLTATVTPSTTDGLVQFNDTSTSPTFILGTSTISNGNATFSISSLSTGTHNIIAKYLGGPNYAASVSSALAQIVKQISTPTATMIVSSQNPSTVSQPVTFTATVSPNTVTGIVQFIDTSTIPPTILDLRTISDGHAIFTTSSLSVGIHKIAAQYIGDKNNAPSTSTVLAQNVNYVLSSSTTLSSNATSVISGQPVTFTAKVSPTSSTGTIQFFLNGTNFSAPVTLSGAQAIITISALPVGIYNIMASYSGDTNHAGSTSNTIIQTVNSPATTHVVMSQLPLSLSTDQSYYAFGDVVTLSVNLPGQVLQNIALGVTDPNGDNIISRTITTDENGTGTLQFKIPDIYKTGLYQDVATALIDGRNYTNSTQFTVIKSHGISIDSVQITNLQGSPIQMLKKNQNAFVRISISSDEKIPTLLTLNLFDQNQSSLGAASVKSIVYPGQSQMALSFFIPSDAQAGAANVFTDAYSDWPSNGGTPLATETCLAVDLQDPSTLPVSYVPKSPHSCTTKPQSGNGTPSVQMTNDQALLTLGVAIQNDSMTFMSPAQAHLLALAYANGTADKHYNSVDLVSLNLDNTGTNSTGSKVSGNVTKIEPAKFTTLLGPDLQNNPMALKILQEIQISKKQVANILGNETAAKLNQQLIEKQRQAAVSTLKQDLTTLEQTNAGTTPNAAYARFLSTVGNNKTKAVFQDEFNFMNQRVSAANTAMQTVLDEGGSLAQAILTFDKYAKINHVQIVSLNNELNVKYGLADSRIQSCFDSSGRLAVVNGINQCVSDIENNSTGPSGISIISVQPTDQQGNSVSLLKRGQTGYLKVVVNSNASTQSLVTVNIFDSNVSSLGTASVQYKLNPGASEIVVPYHIPEQAGTGLASIYANVFTDWPSNGGISQSNELSYFVGLW